MIRRRSSISAEWRRFSNICTCRERQKVLLRFLPSTFCALAANLIIVTRTEKWVDLPLTSSSSMVVLESVDSFSFTCDPSLFFAIMLLPLHIRWKRLGWRKKGRDEEEKVDYDNDGVVKTRRIHRKSFPGEQGFDWEYLLEKFLVASIVVRMAPCWWDAEDKVSRLSIATDIGLKWHFRSALESSS